ncbi:Cinnamoyl-CoA reductase 1 [Linum grandiflorum]
MLLQGLIDRVSDDQLYLLFSLLIPIPMAATKGLVCVTGAGGFLGSWVVRILLSKDYSVCGTVRDPSDEKYAHLKQFPKASTNLKLVKADLLDYPSLVSAFQGCSGVFHVASPVPAFSVSNPQVELLEPAVTGTRNVLKACVETKVNRAVVVSSGAAVIMNPTWPKGQLMDESCWSDKEYCRTTENWYCVSKTEAETLAFEFGKASGLDVVSVCPNLILGPVLQPTMNASTMVLTMLLKEGLESVENKHRMIVDVRDVAEALILVYENAEAQGRYICSAHSVYAQQMVEILKEKYANYDFPEKFMEGHDEKRETSSEKLQSLGWRYRPLEETLVDSVESYRTAGILE